MLRRVYVDNFRCFVNFEFRPGAKQLLLGPNGSGKSTLLEVLGHVRDFSVRGAAIDDLFIGDTLTRWQGSEQQRFELEVQGNDGIFRYELELDAVGSLARPRVLTERVQFDQRDVFLFKSGEVHLFNDDFEDKVKFGSDWHRSALATVSARPENRKLTWFKDWLGGLQCIRVNPFGMTDRAEKEDVLPTRDLANFASWYRHLVQERSAATADLRETLRHALDGFDSLDLKEAGQNTRILKATFRPTLKDTETVVRNTGYELTFRELSDGQRALIALYTLVGCAKKQNTLLCIDEPDNFISLVELQPWLYHLIDHADNEDIQWMLISHHPELLNQLAADCGVVFTRQGGRHVTVRPYQGSPDSDLPPSEQIARGWTDA